MEGYPTMTLHELAEAFRANLVRVSEDKLGQMILEGKFPFAVGTVSYTHLTLPTN